MDCFLFLSPPKQKSLRYSLGEHKKGSSLFVEKERDNNIYKLTTIDEDEFIFSNVFSSGDEESESVVSSISDAKKVQKYTHKSKKFSGHADLSANSTLYDFFESKLQDRLSAAKSNQYSPRIPGFPGLKYHDIGDSSLFYGEVLSDNPDDIIPSLQLEGSKTTRFVPPRAAGVKKIVNYILDAILVKRNAFITFAGPHATNKTSLLLGKPLLQGENAGRTINVLKYLLDAAPYPDCAQGDDSGGSWPKVRAFEPSQGTSGKVYDLLASYRFQQHQSDATSSKSQPDHSSHTQHSGHSTPKVRGQAKHSKEIPFGALSYVVPEVSSEASRSQIVEHIAKQRTKLRLTDYISIGACPGCTDGLLQSTYKTVSIEEDPRSLGMSSSGYTFKDRALSHSTPKVRGQAKHSKEIPFGALSYVVPEVSSEASRSQIVEHIAKQRTKLRLTDYISIGACPGCTDGLLQSTYKTVSIEEDPRSLGMSSSGYTFKDRALSGIRNNISRPHMIGSGVNFRGKTASNLSGTPRHRSSQQQMSTSGAPGMDSPGMSQSTRTFRVRSTASLLPLVIVIEFGPAFHFAKAVLVDLPAHTATLAHIHEKDKHNHTFGKKCACNVLELLRCVREKRGKDLKRALRERRESVARSKMMIRKPTKEKGVKSSLKKPLMEQLYGDLGESLRSSQTDVEQPSLQQTDSSHGDSISGTSLESHMLSYSHVNTNEYLLKSLARASKLYSKSLESSMMGKISPSIWRRDSLLKMLRSLLCEGEVFSATLITNPPPMFLRGCNGKWREKELRRMGLFEAPSSPTMKQKRHYTLPYPHKELTYRMRRRELKTDPSTSTFVSSKDVSEKDDERDEDPYSPTRTEGRGSELKSGSLIQHDDHESSSSKVKSFSVKTIPKHTLLTRVLVVGCLSSDYNHRTLSSRMLHTLEEMTPSVSIPPAAHWLPLEVKEDVEQVEFLVKKGKTHSFEATAHPTPPQGSISPRSALSKTMGAVSGTIKSSLSIPNFPSVLTDRRMSEIVSLEQRRISQPLRLYGEDSSAPWRRMSDISERVFILHHHHLLLLLLLLLLDPKIDKSGVAKHSTIKSSPLTAVPKTSDPVPAEPSFNITVPPVETGDLVTYPPEAFSRVDFRSIGMSELLISPKFDSQHSSKPFHSALIAETDGTSGDMKKQMSKGRLSMDIQPPSVTIGTHSSNSVLTQPSHLSTFHEHESVSIPMAKGLDSSSQSSRHLRSEPKQTLDASTTNFDYLRNPISSDGFDTVEGILRVEDDQNADTITFRKDFIPHTPSLSQREGANEQKRMDSGVDEPGEDDLFALLEGIEGNDAMKDFFLTPLE
ncbi:hypothetical protein ADUPG1_007245 [Aduncisulcus paluster]|uniref:Kinesin motor domain-containing protein n=1 Tax=Aduncisulcus paluster TaxID=2918883 RepID=A0ABQ5KPN4_9EUKA|nr:hypothetical protein ADUPG1_007245 [Aduncisulcus paluster]